MFFYTNGSVNWHELNRLERDLGNWYSHSLPTFGQQQYYELIGKYQQFYQGWNDADTSLGTYEAINTKLKTSATRFIYYSHERGKANDFYSASKRAVNLIILNHILSAIDAALSARAFNTQFTSQIRLEEERTLFGINYYPVMNLKIEF